MSGPVQTEKARESGDTSGGSTNTLNSGDLSQGFTSNTGTSTGATAGGSTSTLNPYGPASGLLGSYLNGLGAINPAAGDQSRNLQNVIGGFDAGQSNTINGLAPYARGDYLNLDSNPYTKQIIDQVSNSAQNNVHDLWSRAGRQFSPGEAGAIAKNTTEGLAPTLFNQFNTQQGNQLSSLGQISNMVNARAGTLPGIYNQMSQSPYSGFSNLSNLLLPIASQFGTQSNTNYGNTAANTADTSNTQSMATKYLQNLMQQYANSDSKSSGTTSQQSDPFQTALGGGIGLLGLL